LFAIATSFKFGSASWLHRQWIRLNGKTEFCNRYDRAYCGSVGADGSSTTNVTHFGNHFIDSQGFGENRIFSETTGDPTLDSLRRILEAVVEEDIQGVLWIVSCTDHNLKFEEVKVMRLAAQMIGPAIPIIAVFNNKRPRGVCVISESSFVKKCAEVFVLNLLILF
jgi:hypothetical protein